VNGDLKQQISEQVREAAGQGRALNIVGGGSKAWYGRTSTGERLDLSGHAGILDYEPRELVIRARAGTPLLEIESVLEQLGQYLPFEPPHYAAIVPPVPPPQAGEGRAAARDREILSSSPLATLGGAIACGLSGPARPYAGSARDHVLGARIVNGKGETLEFGGQVMKNVAGYDLSRLMVGALGTLGVLLDVSLKVLPMPESQVTLVKECNPRDALAAMNGWAGKPLPLSASVFDGNRLIVRLSGTATAVQHAAQRLGGDALNDGGSFWADLREHRHAFFTGDSPLWRLSLPPATPPIELPGKWLIEWGGGQRWLHGEVDPAHIRAAVHAAGGHATQFRGGDRSGPIFHPLPPIMLALHRRLKQAFDPAGILNPGRLYPEL
jgi:glycolate oxidase FAD binding subunit